MIDRILIVGLGSIGKRHLRLARALIPNADIRVLRHLATNEVPEYADGCFITIEEAVAFKPEVAVIASPASLHLATAQALAEAGVHLFIEKPLATSLSGIKYLIETCQKHNAILFTGYNLRFFSSLQQYRELLAAGVIGKVLSVRCEVGQYLPSWRPENDYRLGVSAIRELGGGVLLELSHELDYLRWIFGEVEWIKATLSRQSDLEINVEDTAHLILGFVPALDGSQLLGIVNLDFIRHDTTRICTAIGKTGSLRWDGKTGGVKLYEIGTKEWQELYRSLEDREASYIAEWKNFLQSVLTHKTPAITGEDGLKVIEIIEAARESDLSGGVMCKIESLKKRESNT